MDKQNSGHLNIWFVAFCAGVTSIGGFLFGYDTAVINGANTFLQQHFQLDRDTDSFLIGLVTASAIIGCIPGAMISGFLSDRFGRRKILFLCAFLFAISAIFSAFPPNLVAFIFARLIGGIGIGIASMACPVYIAEIAPPKLRGRLGTLFQLGIVIGIFITLFINGKIQSLGDEVWNIKLGWRWMLGVETIPAVLFILMLIPIPESPKWLIQAGREEEARMVLNRIGGTEYTNNEVVAVREVLAQEEGTFSELFSRDYRLPLTIAVFIMLASQFSGINVVMYYSTDIFKAATGDSNAAFTASVWIGFVNLIATFIAIMLVDKAGRKPLLLFGNAVQVIGLVMVGYIYSVNPHSKLLLGGVITYTAAFAMAMGPIPWILCSEIFPAKLRGRAMSVATFAIWTGCYLVSQTFPYFLKTFGSTNTFWFYAACSSATFLFVLFLIPETKGRSLEEIEKSWHKHAK